jgi:hypothetical protein
VYASFFEDEAFEECSAERRNGLFKPFLQIIDSPRCVSADGERLFKKSRLGFFDSRELPFHAEGGFWLLKRREEDKSALLH